jgi:hypothetical protein
MMYPYAQFLIDFEGKHGELTHTNVPENTRAAIIIETRPLYFLPKVIRNAMYFLGPRWNLYVFSGEPAFPYLQQTLGRWGVMLAKLPGIHRLSSADYSRLLSTAEFWRHFPEEKLLVFQVDCILCGSNVEEFTQYDFVGAPCSRFDEHYVANGGLSLRSKSVMLECSTRFSRSDNVPEDVFFTSAVRQIGAAMPDLHTAASFAVESIYVRHPVGVHGTDKCYHTIETAETIVRGIQY